MTNPFAYSPRILKTASGVYGSTALLNVETIARGRGIRELRRLERLYGKGNWLKKKGMREYGLNPALS